MNFSKMTSDELIDEALLQLAAAKSDARIGDTPSALEHCKIAEEVLNEYDNRAVIAHCEMFASECVSHELGF